MRITRDFGSSAADEEIEIGSRIRLHDVVVVKFLISAFHVWWSRFPSGFTLLQLVFGHFQIQNSIGHIELDNISILNES